MVLGDRMPQPYAEGREPLAPPLRASRTKFKAAARLLVLAILLGCVASVVPVILYLKDHHYEKTVIDHLQHFYEPRLQTLVLRVLWMPVVFSVDNWVALRWQYAGVYMLVLTGWYEAWVLYSFYTYLEVWLEGTVGGSPGSLAELGFVRETPPHRHLLPCCCLRPWRMVDGEFVRSNKVGVLQYTLVQTLCTVITFGTQLGGVWHDGATDPRYAYMYVTVVVNLSQVVALYCLVYFYYTMHDALAPLHPLLKFMCIKLVIFFSFWQEMGVYALVYFKALPEKQRWVSDPSRTVDVAAGIQNFLICFEMLVAVVAHSYAFPIEDYKKGSKEQRAERPHFGKSVQLMFSVSDILSDMGTVFGVTPAARGYETAPHAVEACSRAPPQAPRFARRSPPAQMTESSAPSSEQPHPSRSTPPRADALLQQSHASAAAAWTVAPAARGAPPAARKGSLADDLRAIESYSKPGGVAPLYTFEPPPPLPRPAY